MIQLRKFNEASLAARDIRALNPKAASPGSRPISRNAEKQDTDLASLIGSAKSNEAEVDTSIPGAQTLTTIEVGTRITGLLLVFA